MAYRLKQNESVEEGVRRIATEQLDKALAEIDNKELDRHEVVHQVRKRCKKLRSLVRLVRPVFPDYRRVNTRHRDAARELSYIRDAHAVIETVDQLIEHYDEFIDADAFRVIRDELVDQRDRTSADDGTIDRQIARFRDTIADEREQVESWRLDADCGRSVAGGARKTYQRARKAMAEAADTSSTVSFHQWRKRVKYHWHHARLLQDCWPTMLEPWAQQAHQLSGLLGDEHDLAVLHALLLEDPKRFAEVKTLQAFTGLIERRRAELRAAAFQLGTFVLFEKPKQLKRRIRTYFDAWQKPIAVLSAPAPRDVE